MTAPPPRRCWPRRWCTRASGPSPSGANPIGLKRGIDAAVVAVVDRLREIAREVETTEDMAHVATISARDAEIGALIADAFDKVGKDGVITVDESNTFGTELEFTEGMQFDKGYLSPVLRHRSGADGGRPRRPVHPDQLRARSAR